MPQGRTEAPTPAQPAKTGLPGRLSRLTLRARAPARASTGKKWLSSDVFIAGAGLGLGLVCAVFPWYIFLHQDRFGPRPLPSHGVPIGTPGLDHGPLRVGVNWSLPDRHKASFDTLATGTVDRHPGKAPPADQPFPGDTAVPFDLVQVANGRAMIEDADGFWMVQVGSSLPDNSRVRSIERRDGRWVLVTTDDKIVKLVER